MGFSLYRTRIVLVTLGIAFVSNTMPSYGDAGDITDVNVVVGNKSSCHGVKLSNIIITAAHCIRDGESYTIAANSNGTIDTYSTSRAYAHPDHKKNDTGLGVLVLMEDDAASSMLLERFASKRASVAGKFFTTRTVGYDYINRRPFVENEYFNLERTRIYSSGKPVFKVNYQFLEGKKYFCQGYSGAPVYTFYGDNIALYGIVTKGASAVRGELGEECGDTLIVEPVSEHIEWIKQVSKP